MLRAGVLTLQGAAPEHALLLHAAMRERGQAGEVVAVRGPGDLAGLDCLVLPGGESTTIGKLLKRLDMVEPIREMAAAGTPMMGTCAGCILMAKEGDDEVRRTGIELLGLMDMKVSRNRFGRQRESFECQLEVEGLEEGFPAVFIRGPVIEERWGRCRPLAHFKGQAVMVSQNNLLALSFHPELSVDTRIHRMLLDMVPRT